MWIPDDGALLHWALSNKAEIWEDGYLGTDGCENLRPSST